tara:strand:+ start:612 stop:1268 length:657 start_codon:yes stop_codon:yes gene_type:complete
MFITVFSSYRKQILALVGLSIFWSVPTISATPNSCKLFYKNPSYSLESNKQTNKLLAAIASRYKDNHVSNIVASAIIEQIRSNGIVSRKKDRKQSTFFQSTSIEGSLMSWLTIDPSDGQISAKILVVSLGMREPNGGRMVDGTTPAHPSNEFAKILAGVLNGIDRLRSEFSSVKNVQIQAMTINPRLATTLRKIGFEIDASHAPWGIQWSASMIYKLK